MRLADQGSSRERWTILFMTIVLLVLGVSLTLIIRNAGPGLTLGLQILVLLSCGSLIGGLVFSRLPKIHALHDKALSESESFLRKQQAALWRLTKSTNIHGGVFEEALCEATETAAHTLEVERVSV